MENWGWTFAVIVNEVRVWGNVWTFYGMENCWLFGIEAKKRVFHRQTSQGLQRAKDVVGDALDEIMARDPRDSETEVVHGKSVRSEYPGTVTG
jgi:hypothetical protein